MNFRASFLQPVAGATGVISRVQLPAAGRIAMPFVDNSHGRALPSIAATALRDQPRCGLARHEARHRAQCRANCMSKANF